MVLIPAAGLLLLIFSNQRFMLATLYDDARLGAAAYRSRRSSDWIKVKNPDSPAMRRGARGVLVNRALD
jgi:hypothetical protein